MLKIRFAKQVFTSIFLLYLAGVASAQEVERKEGEHLYKHILHRLEELSRTFEGISFGIGITGIHGEERKISSAWLLLRG